MATVEPNKRFLLTEGLVGEHMALYRESSSFRAAVDTLVKMLPYMMDGLAAEAEKQDRASIERYMALRTHPLTTQFDAGVTSWRNQ